MALSNKTKQKKSSVAVWMIKGFIDGIPLDTEEAALIIQQLAPPEEIYDRPANLFVAGFIGSPAMNLVKGETSNGAIVAEGIRLVDVGGGSRTNPVLGIHPEDLTVVEAGKSDFEAPVYATELTGESVLVTVTAGDQHLAARGSRHMRKAIGETVGIRAETSHAHLFDRATELHLDV